VDAGTVAEIKTRLTNRYERFIQMMGQFARFDLREKFLPHKDVAARRERCPFGQFGDSGRFVSYLIAVPATSWSASRKPVDQFLQPIALCHSELCAGGWVYW
jgi:ABC-type microcin C transport system permease subunit YejB